MSNLNALKEMVKVYGAQVSESKTVVEQFLGGKLMEAKLYYDGEQDLVKCSFKSKDTLVSFIVKNDNVVPIANANTPAPMVAPAVKRTVPCGVTSDTTTVNTSNIEQIKPTPTPKTMHFPNKHESLTTIKIFDKEFVIEDLYPSKFDTSEFTEAEINKWDRLVRFYFSNGYTDVDMLINQIGFMSKRLYNRIAEKTGIPSIAFNYVHGAKSLKENGRYYTKKIFSDYTREEIEQILNRIRTEKLTEEKVKELYPDMHGHTVKYLYKLLDKGTIVPPKTLPYKNRHSETGTKVVSSNTTTKPEEVDLSSIPGEVQAGILNDLINGNTLTEISEIHKVPLEVVQAVESNNKDFVFSRRLNTSAAKVDTTSQPTKSTTSSLDDRIQSFSEHGIYNQNSGVNLGEPTKKEKDEFDKLKKTFHI